MRQLLFALQFKGKQVRWPGRYKAKTSATDQAWRTVLAANGIEASVEPSGSGVANCDAEVETVLGHGVPDEGEGTFTVTGTVKYGTAGKISFHTVGRGFLGPTGIDGLRQGAVIWQITSGDGEFTGATGVVTSNFSVTSDGEMVDNQIAQIFLPS
jgi:hypothetical protein